MTLFELVLGANVEVHGVLFRIETRGDLDGRQFTNVHTVLLIQRFSTDISVPGFAAHRMQYLGHYLQGFNVDVAGSRRQPRQPRAWSARISGGCLFAVGHEATVYLGP
jgi:hypothetical protein|tara:strand:+ start:157 stop:480 length:324 start_codon:yes stop_codon:yes gene_type:complete